MPRIYRCSKKSNRSDYFIFIISCIVWHLGWLPQPRIKPNRYTSRNSPIIKTSSLNSPSITNPKFCNAFKLALFPDTTPAVSFRSPNRLNA